MASRKPSISRASKKATRKPRKSNVNPFDVEVLSERLRNLEDAETRASSRIATLEARSAVGAPALVLDNLVADQLKSVVGSLRGIEESMQRVVERMADLLAKQPVEAKVRKPREPKAEPTNGASSERAFGVPAGAPLVVIDPPKKEKVDRATCGHPTRTPVEGNPKLERCDRCGTTLDRPQIPPVNETKAPTFEELRESAVKYAQKHSKTKMLEALAPFAGVAAADVKLSLIPEEKRRAAMDALVDF